MAKHTSIPKSLVVSLFLAILVLVPEAYAGDIADERMLKVLSQRNRVLCRDLAREFLSSQIGMEDPKVYVHAANCYVSEARLHALGTPRTLSVEGTGLSELPVKIIANETGLSLDPYRPLAGRKLTEQPSDDQ